MDLRPGKPPELVLWLTAARVDEKRTLRIPRRSPSGGPARVDKGCRVTVEDSAGRLVAEARGFWGDGKFHTRIATLDKFKRSGPELVFFAPADACRVRISAPGHEDLRFEVPAGSTGFPVILR